MNFVSIRVITADVQRLARFYEAITGMTMTMYTPDFGELVTPSCTLAIAGTRTLQLFGGDIARPVGANVARPADNHTVILEFRVGDVDAEFERLSGTLAGAIVQEPTTMPWGNRSLLFRDPDGNLVNLFTPVTAEAIRKFDKVGA
ncbi:VOC family protein [Mesorhizobium sp.]|uniref:VOC family protein n=1 Tax=Mesorhizobium sp. TaxID=1871066 RepID=UPI003BAB3598